MEGEACQRCGVDLSTGVMPAVLCGAVWVGVDGPFESGKQVAAVLCSGGVECGGEKIGPIHVVARGGDGCFECGVQLAAALGR